MVERKRRLLQLYVRERGNSSKRLTLHGVGAAGGVVVRI